MCFSLWPMIQALLRAQVESCLSLHVTVGIRTLRMTYLF